MPTESPEDFAFRLCREWFGLDNVAATSNSAGLIALIRARDAAQLKPFEKLRDDLAEVTDSVERFMSPDDSPEVSACLRGKYVAYSSVLAKLRALLPKPETKASGT
jgi:hypothetical protein